MCPCGSPLNSFLMRSYARKVQFVLLPVLYWQRIWRKVGVLYLIYVWWHLLLVTNAKRYIEPLYSWKSDKNRIWWRVGDLCLLMSSFERLRATFEALVSDKGKLKLFFNHFWRKIDLFCLFCIHFGRKLTFFKSFQYKTTFLIYIFTFSFHFRWLS